jgi:hypothetical protein
VSRPAAARRILRNIKVGDAQIGQLRANGVV